MIGRCILRMRGKKNKEGASAHLRRSYVIIYWKENPDIIAAGIQGYDRMDKTRAK
jgi:hypothetical protein